MVHVVQSADVSALKFQRPPHVLILEARFYTTYNDMLLDGARSVLNQAGVTFEVVTVPGALEVPLAMQLAAQKKVGRAYDAMVILGCVIRGETTHYEIVSEESARGIMDMSLKHNIPVGNGILTVENEEQALDRADKNRQDKGGGTAFAALSMLALKQKFEGTVV